METNLVNRKLCEGSLQYFVIVDILIVILGVEVYLRTALLFRAMQQLWW